MAENERRGPTLPNADSDDETVYMLAPPVTGQQRHQASMVNAGYGSVSVQAESPNMNFRTSHDDIMANRKCDEEGKQTSGTREFPAARSRLVLLIIVFVHEMGETATTLQLQYYHARYSAEFFNGTVTPSSKQAASSKCITNSTDPSKPIDDALQEALAQFQMYLSYTNIGPMFISTVFFGAISDVVGRRVLIILPSVVVLCTQTFMMFIIRFELDLRYCFINSALNGSVGATYVLLVGMYAYTADITPPGKKRTLTIALVKCVRTVSVVIGDLTIGFLIQYLGYFYSSFLPLAFKVAILYLAIFCLPESVPEQVRGTRPVCVNPVKYLTSIFGFYFTVGSRRERAMFCLCLACLFCVFVAILNHSTVFTMYELDEPFCWDPEQLGYYSAASTGVTAIVSLAAVHILQKCCSDPVILILGTLSLMGQYVVEGLAHNTTVLYLGALFASIGVVEAASDFVSNTVYNSLYGATVATMRGAVFLIMAGITSLGVVCMLVFIKLSGNGSGTATHDRITTDRDTSHESAKNSA